MWFLVSIKIGKQTWKPQDSSEEIYDSPLITGFSLCLFVLASVVLLHINALYPSIMVVDESVEDRTNKLL